MISFLNLFFYPKQYRRFGALWSRGRHFRVEKIDKNRTTFDCGVKASFQQDLGFGSNLRDDSAPHPTLEYFGTIQDIIKVEYRKFSMFIFDVRWFKVVTQGQQSTIRRDKSGLIQVDSTKVWTDQRDTFALPEHCEQIVFKVDPRDPRWLFVIEIAPRKRQVFEDVQIEESPPQQCEPCEDLHEEVLIELQDIESGVREDIADEPNQAEMEDELAEIADEDTQIDEAQLHLQLEGDSDDDAAVSPINNIEDGEIFLEIDLFGMRDLTEDDRIDEEL